MSALVYVLVGISVLLLAAIVYYFNRMIKLRNKVRRAWKDIDVQLKKRHDLVPLLVRIAEGYSLHEKKVLVDVTKKRTEAQSASGAKDIGDKERILTIGLHDIFLLREEYPELKADSSFRHLQERISSLADQIADRREFYNHAVNRYNIRIEQIPDLFIARFLGYRDKVYFRASEQERQDVEIEFSHLRS